MKKLSLLFASIAIISFTANAQEPVKVKAKQEPVRVAPVQQSIKGEKVEAPKTTTEPTTASTATSTTKPVMYPKKPIMKVTKATATAVPVRRAEK